MIRIGSIALLVLMLVSPVSAQLFFNVELNAGVTLATLSAEMNDTKLDTDINPGFSFGILFTELNLRPKEDVLHRLTFETGLLITSSGASYQAVGTLVNSEQTTMTYEMSRDTKLYNFIFPLMIKQKIGHKWLQYYLDYGCYFGVVLETHNKSNFTYTETSLSGASMTNSFSQSEEFIENQDEDIFDFGLSLGAGIQLDHRFRIGLNYSHGFGNLASTALSYANSDYFLYDTSYKNRVLTFSLGYSLGPNPND